MKNVIKRSSGSGAEFSLIRYNHITKNHQATDLLGFFTEELKSIYWGEITLLRALSEMISYAGSYELGTTLTLHYESTQNHITRLEDVFTGLGIKPEAKNCEAMKGLVKETEEIISKTEPGSIRDEGIISAVQKIEHYEIATYGTLCSFARTLGRDDLAIILQKTLDEEYDADEKLTEIAETKQFELYDEGEKERETNKAAKTDLKDKDTLKGPLDPDPA